MTLRGGHNYTHLPDQQTEAQRVELVQGYRTCKWQSQTTSLGLPASQILFNTSHHVSKRQRVFQSPLMRPRLGCLLHFPPTSLAGHSQSGSLLLARSWLAGWLAGWNSCLGGISGSHAHSAFNAHDWEGCQTAERASLEWGRGSGLINSFLLFPECASASTSLWSDTVKPSEDAPAPGQSRSTWRLAAPARHLEGILVTAPPSKHKCSVRKKIAPTRTAGS